MTAHEIFNDPFLFASAPVDAELISLRGMAGGVLKINFFYHKGKTT